MALKNLRAGSQAKQKRNPGKVLPRLTGPPNKSAGYFSNLLIITTLFCPPKPNDSLIAISTFAFLASFGT